MTKFNSTDISRILERPKPNRETAELPEGFFDEIEERIIDATINTVYDPEEEKAAKKAAKEAAKKAAKEAAAKEAAAKKAAKEAAAKEAAEKKAAIRAEKEAAKDEAAKKAARRKKAQRKRQKEAAARAVRMANAGSSAIKIAAAAVVLVAICGLSLKFMPSHDATPAAIVADGSVDADIYAIPDSVANSADNSTIGDLEEIYEADVFIETM